jgi:hypothetical protein
MGLFLLQSKLPRKMLQRRKRQIYFRLAFLNSFKEGLSFSPTPHPQKKSQTFGVQLDGRLTSGMQT